MSQPLVMSFKPDAAQMCLNGHKRQTRRIFKVGMEAWIDFSNGQITSVDAWAGGPTGLRNMWRVGNLFVG